QQLLSGRLGLQAVVGRAPAAVMAWIFIAGLGACVVQPGAPGAGQGKVGFLNAATDFLEQLLAQSLLAGQGGLPVVVFRLQVSQYLRAVALLQPVVRIAARSSAGLGRKEGHG